MKKILLPLASLLLAVGCENPNTPTPEPDSSEVTFKSSVVSRLSETEFEAGDAISVSAIDAYDVAYAENIEYTFDGGLFKSTEPIKYESTEQTLSFRAVYPAVAIDRTGDVEFSVESDQTVAENYAKSNLMSSITAQINDNRPMLIFNHLMAQIVVNIVESDVEMDGATATLNAKKSVSYNILNNKSTANGDSEVISMLASGDDSFSGIIVPQSIAAGKPLATITVGDKTFDLVFDMNKNLTYGKKYEYDVTINSEGITFEEEINDWEEDDNDAMQFVESVTFKSVAFEEVLFDVDVDDAYAGAYLALPLTTKTLNDDFDGDMTAYAMYYVNYLKGNGLDTNVFDNNFLFSGDIENKNIFDAWEIPNGTKARIMAFGLSSDFEILGDIQVSESFKTVGETEVDPDDLIFPNIEFGTVEVTPFMRSVKCLFTPNNNDNLYLTIVMPRSIADTHPTSEDMYSFILADVEQFLSNFGLTVKEGLQFVAIKGKTYRDIGNLDFDSEYTLVTVSVDPETLLPAAKLVRTEFETLPWEDLDANLESFNVSDISCTNAWGSVKMGEYRAPYFVANVSKRAFESTYNSDLTAMFNGCVNFAKNNWGYADMNLVDSYAIFEGDAAIEIGRPWDIHPESEYISAVAGVDQNGAITTDIISKEWTSTSVPNNFNIQVSFDDQYTTPTTLMVHSTPSIGSLATLVFLLTTEDYESFDSDEDLLAAILSNESAIHSFIKYGDRFDQYLELDQGVSYTAVAFGYSLDKPGPVTKVFTAECETESYDIPTGVECPDVDFGEMNVQGIAATSIAVEILPYDKEMTYLKGKIKTSDYEALGSQEALILKDIDMYIDYAKQAGMDLQNLLTYVYSYKGDIPNPKIAVNQGLYEFLETGVSYTFYAYGYDIKTLQPLTQVEFVEAVPAEAADAPWRSAKPAEKDPLAKLKELINAKAAKPFKVYTAEPNATPAVRPHSIPEAQPKALETESVALDGGSSMAVATGSLDELEPVMLKAKNVK